MKKIRILYDYKLSSMAIKRGKLVFVGLGVKSVSHVTLEAQAWIKEADIVIHHVTDPATERWIAIKNKNNFSLNPLYQLNRSRMTTYKNMVNQIIEQVNKGKSVCVALYGNPAFYVYATHKAAAIARKYGHYVEINPGISSLDCLLADIDIDIVNKGMQVLEATSILIGQKTIDTSSYLIVMQPGPVGEEKYRGGKINKQSLEKLQELLCNIYGQKHKAYIYEAARYAIAQPVIIKCNMNQLAKKTDIFLSTLVIPPKNKS